MKVSRIETKTCGVQATCRRHEATPAAPNRQTQITLHSPHTKRTGVASCRRPIAQLPTMMRERYLSANAALVGLKELS